MPRSKNFATPSKDADETSVASSVGSRSSLRLKRKREVAAAENATSRRSRVPPQPPLSEYDEDAIPGDDEPEDPMERDQARPKRHKSAKPPAKLEEDEENDEENDEDDDMEDDMEDDEKLPASIHIRSTRGATLATSHANAPEVPTPVARGKSGYQAQPPSGGRWNLNATEPTPFKTVRKTAPPQRHDTRTPPRHDTRAPLEAPVEVQEPASGAPLEATRPATVPAPLEAPVVAPAVAPDTTWDMVGQWLPLDSTRTWILLFLVFQVMGYRLWINPILSTTVDWSQTLLGAYQGLVGAVPHGSLARTRAVRPSNHTTAPLDALVVEYQPNMTRALEMVQVRRAELLAQEVESQTLVRQYEALLVSIGSNISLPLQEAYLVQLQSVVNQLEVLMSLDDALLGNPLVAKLQALLTQPNALNVTMNASSTTALLDLSQIQLWPLPSGETLVPCDTKGNQSGLDPVRLVEIRAALKAQADGAAKSAMVDASHLKQVQDWIRKSLQKEVQLWNDLVSGYQTKSPTKRRANGTATAAASTSPLESIRTSIATRLLAQGSSSDEESRRLDYAMIYNGATIVASSPSLVDQLPVLNRLASVLKLRFYGHGPAAALTPSSGASTLGQCWSFHPPYNQAAPTRDVRRGGLYGFLTIQLAQPIWVESIVVEHPPAGVTDKGTSAIRRFTVVGFEESEDDATSYKLGSFEYKFKKGQGGIDTGRQEFAVAETLNGAEVPVLSVVRLEIDSNWGADYACLYRFRVHGQEDDDEDE